LNKLGLKFIFHEFMKNHKRLKKLGYSKIKNNLEDISTQKYMFPKLNCLFKKSMRCSNDKIRIITGIVIAITILSLILGNIIYALIQTIPRNKISPLMYINSITIEGAQIKGEEINVTIEYDLANSCCKPYSQESSIDNVSKIVEFSLMQITCINCGCLPAFFPYVCNMSITLQLAGMWILKAGDVSVNISVIE